MQTFRTIIKLHDAGEEDYKKLILELERRSKKASQRFEIDEKICCEGLKAIWNGDVSIPKIAHTIFLAAPRTGQKYAFHIIKNK